MDQTAPPEDLDRERTRAGRRDVRALALIALLHGLLHSVLLAPWMGEDEPFHLENAALVARGHLVGMGPLHTFADMREAPLTHLQLRYKGYGDDLEEIAEVEDGIIASMRDTGFWRRVDWASRDEHPESFDVFGVGSGASQQPRLYYAALAPLLRLAPGASPLTQLYLARGVSLLLFVGTVLLAYGAARRALPEGPGALLVGLGVALWPMSARMAAVVNNDVLARFLVALVFYLAVRWVTEARATAPAGPRRWALPAAVLVAAALAVFSKPTGATAVLVAALAVLLHPSASRRNARTIAGLAALAAVIGAAVLSYLAQGNPAVRPVWQENLRRLQEGLSPANLAELSGTLVGRFNWESRGPRPDLSEPIGWLLAALVLTSAVALVRRPDWVTRRILCLAWGASVAQFLLVAARGVSKGRYLMPAAPALAILVVVGLFVLVPERHHRRAATVATCGLALFSAFFALTGLVHENWVAWGS